MIIKRVRSQEWNQPWVKLKKATSPELCLLASGSEFHFKDKVFPPTSVFNAPGTNPASHSQYIGINRLQGGTEKENLVSASPPPKKKRGREI